ncbi:MAG TPA: DMT family transporter [Acidocella sp.]|nr:MAG: EamA family transporter [Acidocella sp. 21-58-7]HQU03287.1 DMT family transporter [Acidocella sp.]
MNPATLSGIGAIALWAFLALAARAEAGVPPFELTAIGFGVSGMLGLAWLVRSGQLNQLRQAPRAWAHGVGGLFGYHALYFFALAQAPAAQANLLNYLWPLLIVLLSAWLLGLKLSTHHWLGIALGLVGSFMLLGQGVAFSTTFIPGYAAAIGAAFVWALYSVLSRKWSAAVPTGALAGFCVVTAMLAAIAHCLFEPAFMPTATNWLVAVLLGCGPLGAAFYLWDYGMKQGDPRLIGTLAYITPVASTLLLALAGYAAFSPALVLASLLVAGGGLIASSFKTPPAK